MPIAPLCQACERPMESERINLDTPKTEKPIRRIKYYCVDCGTEDIRNLVDRDLTYLPIDVLMSRPDLLFEQSELELDF